MDEHSPGAMAVPLICVAFNLSWVCREVQYVWRWALSAQDVMMGHLT